MFAPTATPIKTLKQRRRTESGGGKGTHRLGLDFDRRRRGAAARQDLLQPKRETGPVRGRRRRCHLRSGYLTCASPSSQQTHRQNNQRNENKYPRDFSKTLGLIAVAREGREMVGYLQGFRPTRRAHRPQRRRPRRCGREAARRGDSEVGERRGVEVFGYEEERGENLLL